MGTCRPALASIDFVIHLNPMTKSEEGILFCQSLFVFGFCVFRTIFTQPIIPIGIMGVPYR